MFRNPGQTSQLAGNLARFTMIARENSGRENGVVGPAGIEPATFAL